MKLNKLTILMGVGALAYGSANLALVNTDATLTAPTTYDIHYRPYDNPSPAPDFWELGNQARTSYLHDPSYTRTADGAYFNYTTTLDNSDHVIIPLGLEITMTFNRSNTNWTATGSGGYYPSDYNKIGSDNTVGSLANKVYLKFNNQTNKDYNLFFDRSSSPATDYYSYEINGLQYFGPFNSFQVAASTLNRLYVPAYTEIVIRRDGISTAQYFDAWYLQDLGVSTSYEEGQYDGYGQGYDDGFDVGYDDGFGDGTSGVGMTAIFSLAFGVIETIFNIQVLGDITLGTIIIAPIAIALLWFILGIVSGVGGKKQ
jgi:hypothetical protein